MCVRPWAPLVGCSGGAPLGDVDCCDEQGVKCSIAAELFGMDWAAAQSQRRFNGTITSWKNKKEEAVYIMWEGWDRNKANTLSALAGDDENGESFGFKLEPYGDGRPAPTYREPERAPGAAATRGAPPAAAGAGGADGAADDNDDDESDDEADEADEESAPREVHRDGVKWARRMPEAIKEDARAQPRIGPKLNSPTVNPKSITEMFEYMTRALGVSRG